MSQLFVPLTNFDQTKRMQRCPWCAEGARTLGRGLVQPQAERFAKAAGYHGQRKKTGEFYDSSLSEDLSRHFAKRRSYWYRLRTYIHAELVQYAKKKQPSGHILFDRMVKSGKAIRR